MDYKSIIRGHEGNCIALWFDTKKSLHPDHENAGMFINTKRVFFWPWPIKVGKQFYGVLVDGVVVYDSFAWTEDDDDKFIWANYEIDKELRDKNNTE